MESGISLQQMLANLEAQMDLHREQEAHHAREEAAHREQRAIHAAELATLARHYEALKSSAEAAAPLAARHVPPTKEPLQETLPPGKPVIQRDLVERVVAEMPKGEAFSPTSIAAAVNRRFRNLPKPAEPRMASTVLRRLAAEGRIRVVQKGTSHRETTYTRA